MTDDIFKPFKAVLDLLLQAALFFPRLFVMWVWYGLKKLFRKIFRRNS